MAPRILSDRHPGWPLLLGENEFALAGLPQRIDFAVVFDVQFIAASQQFAARELAPRAAASIRRLQLEEDLDRTDDYLDRALFLTFVDASHAFQRTRKRNRN